LSITKTTITEFAAELKLTVPALLKQLSAAGVADKTEESTLAAGDKSKLLDYLRKQHGAADESAGKRITLTRKSTTELRTADATGKARTVQVEVRKKRVLVTRAAEAPAPAAPAPVVTAEKTDAPAKPILSDEEAAARAAEEARANALREAQDKAAQEKASRSKAKSKTASKDAVGEEAATDAVAEAPAKEDAKEVAKAPKVEEKAPPAEVAAKPSKASDADKPAAKQESTLSRPRIGERVEFVVKPKTSETTLHRPNKPGVAKPSKDAATAKTAAKPGEKKAGAWQEDAARKKVMKTRDAAPEGEGDGWKAAGKGGKSSGRRTGPRGHREERNAAQADMPNATPMEIVIPETITVAELAHKMAIKAAELIKSMMKMGQMVTINQVLDRDTAMILVEGPHRDCSEGR
jgi:translation initiation factor IF-2